MKMVALLFIVQITLSTLFTIEAKLVNGCSVDLFHYDSPLSPFYNFSTTQREVLLNAALRSTSQENKAKSVVLQDGGGGYLTKIFIGTPPVESIVSIDTSSALLRVPCLSLGLPNKSSTYKKLHCDSPSCSLFSSSIYCAQNQCRYKSKNRDGSVTMEDMASDVISFGSNGNHLATSSKSSFAFGCGHHNKEIGVMGLGAAPMSLVSQLGDQNGRIFSYCLAPINLNKPGKLTFGSQLTQTGPGDVSTHFKTKPQKPSYYLTLEAISVNDDKLTTPNDIFIDSNTTLTKLESKFFEIVETSVVNAITYVPVSDPPYPFTSCFGADDLILDDVPDITFHFAGADLQLPAENMFGMVKNMLCFLIVPSDGYSVFGATAQVNFNVEFDLGTQMVSFKPTKCTKK